jgi:hypothetical protein
VDGVEGVDGVEAAGGLVGVEPELDVELELPQAPSPRAAPAQAQTRNGARGRSFKIGLLGLGVPEPAEVGPAAGGQ